MTSSAWQRVPWLGLIGAHLVISVLLAFALFRDRPFALSDVSYYFEWSGLIAQGQVPYRDFFYDYPPLSIPAVAAPRIIVGFADLTYGSYVVLFGMVMSLLSVAAIQAARVSARALSLDSTLRSYLIPLTLAMPLMLIRFEPWPMLLTALALLATIRRRPAWSGVWLGLGIATKLYPAVVVPAFVAHWMFSGGVRSARIHLSTTVLAAAAVILPFVAVSGGGMLETLAFQRGRGLQLETAAAGIIQLLNIASPERIEIVHVTTYELVSDAVEPFLTVQPVLAFGAMFAVASWGAYRIHQAAGTSRAAEALAAASVAMIISFILTNRALSPQHILWLLPFAWMLIGYPRLVMVAIVGLTLLVFPILYPQLLAQDPIAIVLLNARNALLAGLAVVVLARPYGR